MAWINLQKLTATDSPHVVRMMTRPQIEKQIAQRKFAWRKPIQQIADEAGVSRDTIKAVLCRESVSEESYAKLTSYLKTSAGIRARMNNRQGRASKRSGRRLLTNRVMRLTGMAIDYGINSLYSRASCDSMTEGELRAYYYRLDFRLKEKILSDPKWSDDIVGKYVIPDSLEAWEWVERLDQLTDRQTISEKLPNVRTGHLAASAPGKANPYISPKQPYRSP